MKKLSLLPLLFVFALISNAQAETIALKNGSKITGKIISQDTKKVKIEVDGAPMTYYMDEIDSVDGAAATEAVAPAATKTAEEVAVETPVVAKPAAVASGSSTVDPTKKALILKFIDVFGTKAAMTENLKAMTDNLPEDNPDYQKIKKGINVDEIIERLVPVYDKYFTQEDLNEYITFYASAKGKKLIDAISKVMRESVDVSAEYFQEKFPETANQEE